MRSSSSRSFRWHCAGSSIVLPRHRSFYAGISLYTALAVLWFLLWASRPLILYSSPFISSHSPMLRNQLRPAILLTLLLCIVTGVLYPGAVTLIAQLVFPKQ